MLNQALYCANAIALEERLSSIFCVLVTFTSKNKKMKKRGLKKANERKE